MKINLGSGGKKLRGYVNCDIDKGKKPDVVLDFNEPLPFKDDSFDEVLMSHSLEHCKDLGFTLSECFRVAQRVKIIVPSSRSPHYKRKSHNYFFESYGLVGRHRKLPEVIQKFLGKFIPTEYIIKINKLKMEKCIKCGKPAEKDDERFVENQGYFCKGCYGEERLC